MSLRALAMEKILKVSPGSIRTCELCSVSVVYRKAVAGGYTSERVALFWSTSLWVGGWMV